MGPRFRFVWGEPTILIKSFHSYLIFSANSVKWPTIIIEIKIDVTRWPMSQLVSHETFGETKADWGVWIKKRGRMATGNRFIENLRLVWLSRRLVSVRGAVAKAPAENRFLLLVNDFIKWIEIWLQFKVSKFPISCVVCEPGVTSL